MVVMEALGVQNDLCICITSMYYWLDGSAINDYKEQNKKQNLYYVNEKPELSFEHIET